MRSHSPVIEMRGLNKSFGSVQVLHDVHFDLLAGEVHVLAGENGAGKSTLMRILSGAYGDYTGDYMLDGEPVRFSDPAEAALAGIAMIHQELSLVPSMSVLDNLFLGREQCRGRLGWLQRGLQVERAKESLRRLGLDLDPDTPVERLSLPVQQMLEIAKALLFDARVIIMDEPTSALGKPDDERLFALIEALRDEGKAIVYISHKMDEIYRLADRITVLRDGRWVGTEKAEELSQEKLVQWLIGRDLVGQYPERSGPVGTDTVLDVRNLEIPESVIGRSKCPVKVSFALKRGEILGIAGLEGAGNHEVLLGLFGHYGSLSGEVLLDDHDYVIVDPAHAIRHQLALVTNDRKRNGLVLNMEISQNTTMASLSRISPNGWIEAAREREVAKTYGESLKTRYHSIDAPVSSLSGGNQQKVVLAKWLMTRPSVLFLDDPTRGVDVGAKKEIYELMREWTRSGLSILLISSEMPELLAMSDRVLVMHRGVITGEFEGDEMNQESILRCAMGEVRNEALSWS